MRSDDADRPVPPVQGLVLAGGRGTRLGRDKGTLDYHGAPQAVWLLRLLAELCGEAFVSIRADQAARWPYRGLPAVCDRPGVEGPAAGLLAAWDRAPASAWLVVAADLPRVDRPLLAVLLERRRPERLATAFRHSDGTPEPLCAIWEPHARPRIEAALPGPSLRRVLEEDGFLIDTEAPDKLSSVNSPEDDAAVRALLARDR